uniref:Late blight resistance protein Rpi-blb2 n=1 Tax=Solanum tuberosum TaxID=4113 RepID=M1AQX0_SOLTU
MEKRKDNEEANNSLVLFSALHKDIADVLDFLERLENEENQKALDKDLVEKLKLELAFICTYVQLSYCNLEQFEDIMTRKRQEVENLLQPLLDDDRKDVGCKYVLTSLAGNMDNCISLYHGSSKSDATMMDEQLDFLLLNLYHLSKHRAEKMFPGVTQYEVLQNVCGNVRDFHGLIVNGCIKHEMVENVLPLFQLMAERVGHFLWEDQTDENAQLSELDEDDQTDENAQLSELDEDDQNDRDSRLFKLAHLLLKIVPIELELMNIYLDVISITGMPGSGKTTLAFKVYTDKSISCHFDLRAWCTVDQEYDEKNLLNKIFNQVNGSDSKLIKNIDVVDKLRKQLYGKRYLIVLDDVWDTTTWDELTRPFPEVEKGSRIILTTREKEVALHGMIYTDPLNLRLLRSEESWELLEKRAFGNESCPDELLDVGKEIAENCKGLPLVVDLIAGVIAGRENKKSVWLEVVNNLHSFILKNEVEVMKVIEISYDHLPDHLKPCLLYFASRPKDKELTIYELKCVWGAEGFVEKTEMKSMEEVVKIYLDGLISSSLVICFNEIGDDPTYQVHDLVHDYCLIKAREEKLFDLISSSATSDLLPRQITIDYDDDEEHFGLNFDLFGSNKKRHSGKHLYSLRINGDKMGDCLSDTFHLRHLRLLRVLYLGPSFIMVKDTLLNEICMLNHLRYLRIGTQVKSLPLSFSNLWNLEFLRVDNKESTLILLPRIWDLVKLRLVAMNACSFFDMDADESILIAEDTKLEKLTLLGQLLLSYSKDTEDIFKRFPNLQHLTFELKESWDYSTEHYWFPKLDFLTELEDLKVSFASSNTNDSGSSAAINRPWDFHFPSSLKRLWLNEFPMTSDSLSTIARLPNLEELFLYETIIHGEEWNMGEEDTFENLKYLKLYQVTLSKWEVGEESFPSLEKLKLEGCRKLEEIPPSFGDIYSLKIIKLVKSPQLEDSALKIKEYAEDLRGGDELQILGQKNIPLFK